MLQSLLLIGEKYANNTVIEINVTNVTLSLVVETEGSCIIIYNHNEPLSMIL